VLKLQGLAGNRAMTDLLAPKPREPRTDAGALAAVDRTVERISEMAVGAVLGGVTFRGAAALSPLPVFPPAVQRVPATRLRPAPPPQATCAAVQRYQAGESGHGGIEDEALRAAGFSGDMGSGDIGAVYFGNWARDLSQLSHNAAFFQVIDTLAWGEFGHGITAYQLGGYLASEHLDNPAGGTSPETAGVAVDPSMGLSDEQRKWLEEEATPKFKAMIAAKAAASGLPDYIERGKEHAKRKLADAVRKGHTPDGMMDMGNAMHAMEDYFSHSNFIEVAFSILIDEKTIDPSKRPWSDFVKREAELGYDAVHGGGRDSQGRDQIVSGSYAKGPNDMVSRLELINTEMTNGALRRALFLGYFRRFVSAGAEIGGSAGSAVGSGIGTVAGGVGGGIEGAASGAAAGFKRGKGFFGTIGSTLGGLVGGGASGATSGAAEGARVGGSIGGDVGTTVGADTGAMAGEAIMAAALRFVGPLMATAIATAKAAADSGKLDELAEQQTKAAQAQSKGAPGGGLGVTHSALAKDAPDHPLFGASRQLAVEMDKAVGRAMQKAWADAGTMTGPAPEPAAGAAPDPKVTAAADEVARLVDQYIAHPRGNDWWKPVVTAEAHKVAGAAGAK
jgi:hypothetical protein